MCQRFFIVIVDLTTVHTHIGLHVFYHILPVPTRVWSISTFLDRFKPYITTQITWWKTNLDVYNFVTDVYEVVTYR